MRYRISFFACLLALAVAPASAKNLYAGGQLGTSIASESTLVDASGLDQSIGYGTGFSFAGFFGGQVTEFLRIEVEESISINPIDDYKLSGVSFQADGSVLVSSLMGNAFFEVTVAPGWRLYGGAGIGFAVVAISQFDILGSPTADDSDVVTAWQLGAGVEFDMTPRVALQLDFRHFATADASFTAVNGAAFTLDYQRRTFRIGARWKF